LIKTILAWLTAQIQSQIQLHIGLATLDPILRLTARLQLGSAPFGSAQLSSAHGWWRGRWSHYADMACYCTCWCHNYIRMTSSLACLLYMLTSSLSGSVTWVGSTGIRVGSTHPGQEDAWGASARVGRRLAGEWWRVRPCPTSDFDAVFTSGFVSSSSTRWYGQNTILTTFIFWAKIKHHFKPYALIPIVGNSDRWYSDICPLESKHTDTIFNVVRQTAYIHGRSHCII